MHFLFLKHVEFNILFDSVFSTWYISYIHVHIDIRFGWSLSMYMFRLLFDIEADENFSLDFGDPSQEASPCDLEE